MALNSRTTTAVCMRGVEGECLWMNSVQWRHAGKISRCSPAWFSSFSQHLQCWALCWSCFVPDTRDRAFQEKWPAWCRSPACKACSLPARLPGSGCASDLLCAGSSAYRSSCLLFPGHQLMAWFPGTERWQLRHPAGIWLGHISTSTSSALLVPDSNCWVEAVGPPWCSPALPWPWQCHRSCPACPRAELCRVLWGKDVLRFASALSDGVICTKSELDVNLLSFFVTRLRTIYQIYM